MSGTSKYRVRPLSSLHVGQLIPVDGDSTIEVDAELAQSFGEGDQVIPVAATGCSPAQLLHIPKVSLECVKAAVDRAEVAGTIMKETSNDTIAHFYTFAIQYLQDDEIWSAIAEVNKKDVAKARACGRSITRLQVSDEMRRLMIEGLDTWRTITPSRGQILQRVVHPARPDVGQSEWVCELVASELGIVSFVFEGRPNVVIDATGVLRSGNTVVFRIGRDALETARCIVQRVIHPALERAGLPTGAVSLVDDVAHASAWALFRDKRLALAVARGSGTSVALLGGLARAAGIPVSLHGTGGAWMIISSQHPLDAEATALAVAGSLDRKVCNTLNTICICDGVSSETMDAVACGLAKAAEKRGVDATKVHIVAKTLNEQNVLRAVFSRSHIHITDTTDKQEPLCTEWEWEDTPEVTLCLVQDTAEAIELFNKYSPRFVLSMMSADATECDTTFRMAECPFFCTGITRWVDGQYALRRPELGLTNWEFGRLFGRGGILTGDGIFSVKTRVVGNLLQK